jgi:hypothetical protein
MPDTFTSHAGNTVSVRPFAPDVRIFISGGISPIIKKADAFDFAAEVLFAAGLLPEVKVGSHNDLLVDGTTYFNDSMEIRRKRALREIAMARHLAEHPPVDPETVTALASDIAMARDFDSASLAERLVRLGWTKPTTKEN